MTIEIENVQNYCFTSIFFIFYFSMVGPTFYIFWIILVVAALVSKIQLISYCRIAWCWLGLKMYLSIVQY